MVVRTVSVMVAIVRRRMAVMLRLVVSRVFLRALMGVVVCIVRYVERVILLGVMFGAVLGHFGLLFIQALHISKHSGEALVDRLREKFVRMRGRRIARKEGTMARLSPRRPKGLEGIEDGGISRRDTPMGSRSGMMAPGFHHGENAMDLAAADEA